MKLSPKQRDSLCNSNARINIWQGAVRSGKTFSSIIRFIEFALKGPAGEFVLCGRTDRTVKRNIIVPLQELLGRNCSYSPGNAELKICDRMVYIVGANDERAEAKIRGMTLAGAYVDEITIIPESFFNMLLSRLSVSNAKLFGSTNPDGPYHWFKTKWIDRRNELDFRYWDFHLNDNPSLDQAYVKALKQEYTGLWYQRFIEGKWVLAEGSVYDFFDEATHVIDEYTCESKEYIIGIDYGTHNPTCFLLIGIDKDTEYAWVEKEYYYDGRKHFKQKSDSEYCKDLIEFKVGYRVRKIYLDPSAASFKVELRKNGVSVLDADNSVIDGIRTVSKKFQSSQLKILKSCKNLISEMSSYVWDERAASRGEDKPLKANDHACDALRYAIHSYFGKYKVDHEKISSW